jgi:hypothetical protein
MPTTDKTPHKLGANRKEPARHSHGRRSPSESRDVREDRGERQAKFGHPAHTVTRSPKPARNLAPRRPKYQAGSEPRLLAEHVTSAGPKPVRLRLVREGARSVFIAGSFNNWQPRRIALRPVNAGIWEIDLLLPPGEYEYRFVADGEWLDDPLACRVVTNPFGGVNAVLQVRG